MLDTTRLMKLIDEYALLFVSDVTSESSSSFSSRKKEEIKRELHQIEMKYQRMENQVRKAKIFMPF